MSAPKQPTYPLMEHEQARLHAASGRPLADVTLDAAANGKLGADDLQIDAATLRAQAAIAQQAGYAALAANLIRAAELTAVPNAEVLRMYDLLRPGRSTFAELSAVADQLESHYQATTTAAFVHEAAAVYQTRNLFRRT